MCKFEREKHTESFHLVHSPKADRSRKWAKPKPDPWMSYVGDRDLSTLAITCRKLELDAEPALEPRRWGMGYGPLNSCPTPYPKS